MIPIIAAMLSRIRPVDHWEFPEFSRESVSEPILGLSPCHLVFSLIDRGHFEGEYEEIKVEVLNSRNSGRRVTVNYVAGLNYVNEMIVSVDSCPRYDYFILVCVRR